MSDQGYYVSEAEQIRLLRARFETAEGLLREARNLFIGTRQNLSPRELDWLARSSFAGQGKEPIITGSSLEPTDRAQSGAAPHDPVPGACVCNDPSYGEGSCLKHAARPPLEPPCETCGGRRQVFVTEAADPKVFEDGTITYAKPCPRCRPPKVPTCAPQCGLESDGSMIVGDWNVYTRGMRRFTSQECWREGRCVHPRHPAPREGR